MSDLEKFWHNEEIAVPELIRAAISHYQFETIHPFLDGNGRVGRLLITLFLIERGRMTQPLLYLSVFIEAHRQEYYELLQRVRTDGDWSTWLRWFLRGVEVTARDAARRAEKLMEMRETYRQKLASKATPSRLLDALFINPYLNTRRARQTLKCSDPTAINAIRELEKQRVVREVSGRQWNRVYVARDILEVLQAPITDERR